jgi:hypothetical protein
MPIDSFKVRLQQRPSANDGRVQWFG